jgi:alpha-methylacyl-CoA racemase
MTETEMLEGITVLDLASVGPAARASRWLADYGATVVKVGPVPKDTGVQITPPFYAYSAHRRMQRALVDMKAPEGREAFLRLVEHADVLIESFRPGVVDRLGVGPGDLPESVVYCSFTGFGVGGRHELRAAHDLNYQGWAGLLADTAPAMPPTQLADLAGGALTAVTRILAALLERERTGRGAHIVVSLAHGAHRLVSHRLGGEPIPRLLTGGLACYRIYETADGRHLTVAALEPGFFNRLCELLDLTHLTDRQYDGDAQEEIGDALAKRLASKPLPDWLELFDGEDVSVGPVATLEEAATELA